MNAGRLVLINGDAMPFGLRRGIETALAAPPADATGLVTEAMSRKSPRELALIREACASLDAALDAMRGAQRAGKGITDTVLAGEQAAWRRGAQDVRTLFGRNGGLAPFTVSDNAPADPMQVYVAARHDGYWAEGFAVLSAAAVPVNETAQAVLAKAVTLMQPNRPQCDVADFIADTLGERRDHPLTDFGFGQHVGLSLNGPRCLRGTSTEAFAAGEVYSVQTDVRDGGDRALVSAMVLITEDGNEILWRGADQ
jgi:Xaa-Pro aminopeptidase